MPTYEYKCDACGDEFAREQRITEKPLRKCPACGKLKARRMISGGDFILKGGGWYSDLYSSAKPKSKSDAKPEAKAAKSETKPAKKTESSSSTAAASD